MAKKPARKSGVEYEMPVVRDGTFARVVADNTIIINLGRDYELAFLQVGPELKAMAVVEHNGKMANRYEPAPVMTEVVRVRMSPDSIAQMAMHILENLITANQVVNDTVLEGVKTMIANASSEESQ